MEALQRRGGVAIPRGRVPNGGARLRAYAEPRSYGYARPRVTVPVVVYPRRYYAFRPRFGLGLGLYLGYAVPYPVTFGYPAYVYGTSIAMSRPAPGTYGGLSFDVQPDDAEVSVDGVYVGLVRDFSPTHEPLTLTTGPHHIELQAPNAAPLAFDVDVVPDQVLPFQGVMPPL